MKKKTAIALGALALLASGITFGGFKIKEKKEKDKIEQELKSILIPNAEQELDELLKRNADLNDSVIFYGNLLSQQSNAIDAQKKPGPTGLGMHQDINELSSLLKSVQNEWKKEMSKVYDQWADFYIGDGAYDSDAVPESVKKRTVYLKYGIMKNLYNVDTFYIPGEYKQYYASGQYNDIELFDQYGLGEYTEYGDDPSGYDFGNVLQELQFALKATKGSFTTSGTNGNRVFYPMTSGQEIKEVLTAIQTVLDNIDGAQKVINPETVNKAKTIVQKLLISAEQQIKMEQKRASTEKTLNGFKNAKKQIEDNINKTQKQLEDYKKTDATERMYKARRSNSNR